MNNRIRRYQRKQYSACLAVMTLHCGEPFVLLATDAGPLGAVMPLRSPWEWIAKHGWSRAWKKAVQVPKIMCILPVTPVPSESQSSGRETSEDADALLLYLQNDAHCR